MNIKTLKITALVICLPLLPIYLIVAVASLFGQYGSYIQSLGTWLFIALFFWICFSLYKIVKTQDAKILTRKFLLIILIFILFFLFVKNSDNLWRLEANYRNIKLLDQTATSQWRDAHCKSNPSKNTICITKKTYPDDKRLNYFECDDNSTNYCDISI